MYRAGASRLVGRARHSANDHRNRGLYGVLGGCLIDTELLADLLYLLRAKMLMYQVDDAHGFRVSEKDWLCHRRHEATRARNRRPQCDSVQLVHQSMRLKPKRLLQSHVMTDLDQGERMAADDSTNRGGRADFSDVTGDSSSTGAPQADRPRTITVQAGDSLSKIAKRELGDANKWHAIYEANKDRIKNPDLIHPGDVLNLPNA